VDLIWKVLVRTRICVLFSPLYAIKLECAEEANAEGNGYRLPLDFGVLQGRVQPRAERLFSVEILLVECSSCRGKCARGCCHARMTEIMLRASCSQIRSHELAGVCRGHGYCIIR
jgi:hypothetical protein